MRLADWCHNVTVQLADRAILFEQANGNPFAGQLITTLDEALNGYLQDYREATEETYVIVPIYIDSSTIGKLELYGLCLPWTTVDLDITAATPSATNVYEGTIVTITTTVQNYYNTTVDYNLTLYIDSIDEDNILDEEVSEISGPSSQNVQVQWNTLGHTGSHYLYLEIDRSDDIYERNEANNQFTVNPIINVNPHNPNDPTYDYDFVAISITSEKSVYYDGDIVHLDYCVGNNGWDSIASLTMRIYIDSSLLYSTQISINPFSSYEDDYDWISATEVGIWQFEMKLDPLQNISEFNEDNNIVSMEITVLDIPDETTIYTDDYNETNWTMIDESAIVSGTAPENGDYYWRTIPGQTGVSTLSITQIDLRLMNESSSNYYLNFTSKFNIQPSRQGYIYIKHNGSSIQTQIASYTLKSGGGATPIWYTYSINLTPYVDQDEVTYYNSTLIFSINITASQYYWYIDNITISKLHLCGESEDGTQEFYLGDWGYSKWEYFQSITHTGNLWHVTNLAGTTCWWNGNAISGNYVNNEDNYLISQSIFPTKYNSETGLSISFKVKYYLNSPNDCVEFSILNSTTLEDREIFDTYSGICPSWTTKLYDITEYLGQYIWLVFRMKSDSSSTNTGFYLDPIEARDIKGDTLAIASHGISTTSTAKPLVKYGDRSAISHYFMINVGAGEEPSIYPGYIISSDQQMATKQLKFKISITVSYPNSGAKYKWLTELACKIYDSDSNGKKSGAAKETLKVGSDSKFSYTSYYTEGLAWNAEYCTKYTTFLTSSSYSIPAYSQISTKYLYIFEFTAYMEKIRMVAGDEVTQIYDTMVYQIPLIINYKAPVTWNRELVDFAPWTGLGAVNPMAVEGSNGLFKADGPDGTWLTLETTAAAGSTFTVGYYLHAVTIGPHSDLVNRWDYNTRVTVYESPRGQESWTSIAMGYRELSTGDPPIVWMDRWVQQVILGDYDYKINIQVWGRYYWRHWDLIRWYHWDHFDPHPVDLDNSRLDCTINLYTTPTPTDPSDPWTSGTSYKAMPSYGYYISAPWIIS
jgi:hypothetical protein